MDLMARELAVGRYGTGETKKAVMEKLEKLTRREEQLMRIFWERGPLFVRELVEISGEPKPHFNTLSTWVRLLEAKGYLGHESFGNTYRYYPLITEAEFGRGSLSSIVGRYFKDSYLGAVSALIEDEKISLDELRGLIRSIEEQNASDDNR